MPPAEKKSSSVDETRSQTRNHSWRLQAAVQTPVPTSAAGTGLGGGIETSSMASAERAAGCGGGATIASRAPTDERVTRNCGSATSRDPVQAAPPTHGAGIRALMGSSFLNVEGTTWRKVAPSSRTSEPLELKFSSATTVTAVDLAFVCSSAQGLERPSSAHTMRAPAL
jgi:hypothetical protein